MSDTKIPAIRLGPIAIGGCVIRLPLASGGGLLALVVLLVIRGDLIPPKGP